MGFNPTTDVVLDVLNAADPARASLAAERLQALASGAPASDFSVNLDKAAAAAAAAKAPQPPGLANARQAFADATLASGSAGEGEGRVRGHDAEFVRRRNVAKGLARPVRTGNGGRDLALDALGADFEADRQIGRAGTEPAAFRHARTCDGRADPRATREGAAVATSANALSAPAAADIANGAILTAARRRT